MIATTIIRHAHVLNSRRRGLLLLSQNWGLEFLLVSLNVLVPEDRNGGSGLANATFGRITPINGLRGFDSIAVPANFFRKIAMLSEPLLD